MRYLFFDIECCNGRNICEFGYVITDINFNILEKKDITINPKNKKFNLVGRPNREDLILFYPYEVYYNSPMFKDYYKEIKELIEFPDQLIIGHSIINDAKFLNIACWDFKLPPINFKFADSQKMYEDFYDVKNNISLANAGEQFNVEKPQYLHKSDDDAELTMGLVRNMCKSLDCTLEELIDLCEFCTGSNDNFRAEYVNFEQVTHARYEKMKGDKRNRLKNRTQLFFNSFVNRVKPQGEIIPSRFNNKTWCISLNYEMWHFREMLALVQLLKNRGANYNNKASENDIYISYDQYDEKGNLLGDPRLRHVTNAIDSGKVIEIVPFKELLGELGTSEQELYDFPFPEEALFLGKNRIDNCSNKTNNSKKHKSNKKAKQKDDTTLVYSTKDQEKTTLGSIFSGLLDELRDNL